ncbi:MAG: hypothetical protein MI861_16405 [Pirellulales bacterium]|nr:hypothetical protein [Pirellulales bacterium]
MPFSQYTFPNSVSLVFPILGVLNFVYNVQTGYAPGQAWEPGLEITFTRSNHMQADLTVIYREFQEFPGQGDCTVIYVPKTTFSM